ncbi:hypothetical protein B0H10DRAFT_1772417, partial [Mycena sp. CBHHK59/15]
VVSGVAALGIVVFGVFSIYMGSVWETPYRALPGWVVDFDGGSAVGQAVIRSLSDVSPGRGGIAWKVVSASRFPEGLSGLENAVVEEETWAAVAINVRAGLNLAAALSAVDEAYDPTSAITFIGAEARNEAAYRNVLRPQAIAQLEALSQAFALAFAKNISTSSNISDLLSTAPQILTRPISYTIKNIRPFDVEVASAVTFVGMIVLLILSVSLISNGARQTSGIERHLALGSLVRVRLATSFAAYFFIALFYTILGRAFQLPFNRRFGEAGFVIFWMFNWIGMLACGLALEAVITVVTVRFIPFFLILWIISNLSIAQFPPEAMPPVYRYGYAFPFYNISRAVRTIVFSTKNHLGRNFGILIAWVALSCVTLPLFQWLMRRKMVFAQIEKVKEDAPL